MKQARAFGAGVPLATQPRSRGFLDEMANRGTFWVEFGVEPRHGGHALALVLDQMQRLRTADVPSREHDLAKIQLLGHLGARLSSNGGILRALTAGFLRGDPP